ncbi:MAG: c-type cytochrome [Saprospiraceae bacterium]|nr:c-type cytochrome [Candidatus Defluviibacterium haderslevense]
MKKVVKIATYVLGLAVLLIALLLTYVKIMLPSVGKSPDMKIELTKEKVEHGKYLANHVMVCMDCHSTRNWTLFSGPPIIGTEGKGGEIFDQKLGFPGKYIASNITPHHLGDWTDGEIFRAITTGVSKDGRALFSIMPHHNFGQLDKLDIESVIAYIKGLAPIEFEPEKSSSDFPMNLIINTISKKAAFTAIPSVSNTINYGKYLVTASGCMDCHTKQDKGKFVGKRFAGGFEFKLQDGSVTTSSNITPDKETGIGSWSKEKFITQFKMYSDSSYKLSRVNLGEFQTPMPWTMYAGMTADDLGAIYDYINNLEPVENSVMKFVSAKK